MKSKIGNKVYDWSKLKRPTFEHNGLLFVIEDIFMSGAVLTFNLKKYTISGRDLSNEKFMFDTNNSEEVNAVLYQLHNWYGIELEPEVELEKITSIKRLKEVCNKLNESDDRTLELGFVNGNPCVVATDDIFGLLEFEIDIKEFGYEICID